MSLAGIGDLDHAQFNADRCERLDRGELADSRGFGGIAQNRDAADARRDFFEQLEPFRSNGVFEHKKAGGIPARPRQALDQARAYRIDNPGEHDRHAAARLLQGQHSSSIGSEDDVWRERDQFRCI
jgi:hypothetical protein